MRDIINKIDIASRINFLTIVLISNNEEDVQKLNDISKQYTRYHDIKYVLISDIADNVVSLMDQYDNNLQYNCYHTGVGMPLGEFASQFLNDSLWKDKDNISIVTIITQDGVLNVMTGDSKFTLLEHTIERYILEAKDE